LSNNTILEANTNTANEAKYKKSITVSNGTYNRLLKAGRFSDRSFDKVIARLWQRGFTGREIILEMPAKQSPSTTISRRASYTRVVVGEENVLVTVY
jgi:predicted CopG family antitoxin